MLFIFQYFKYLVHCRCQRRVPNKTRRHVAIYMVDRRTQGNESALQLHNAYIMFSANFTVSNYYLNMTKYHVTDNNIK